MLNIKSAKRCYINTHASNITYTKSGVPTSDDTAPKTIEFALDSYTLWYRCVHLAIPLLLLLLLL